MRIWKFSLLALIAVQCPVPADADEGLSAVVDPLTGAVSLRNDTGAAVELDGYLFKSTESPFTPSGLSSLTDGQAPGWSLGQLSDNLLSEVNLLESLPLPANGTVSLGTPYTAVVPTEIGQREPEFSFSYSLAGGGVFEGDLEFEVDNNLVLVVDRIDGSAQIVNQSPFDVSIDSYNIQSPPDGSVLSSAGWTPLGGALAEWVFDSQHDRISEVSPFGSTMIAGDGGFIDLGAPIDAMLLDDEDQLTLNFSIAASGATPGRSLQGSVLFVGASTTVLPGDFNGDQRVDAADYTVWRDYLGLDEAVLNGAGDGQNNVDQADYLIWKSNYGASGSPATDVANLEQAPEPSSAAALAFAALLQAFSGTRRRGSHNR